MNRASSSAPISIGIAPFDVEGGSGKDFADSFRLELSDALARLPNVRVRATNSFSNNRRDPAAIHTLQQTLQLDNVLFGKLLVNGDSCVLDLELVRSRDDVQLGSFHYQGTTEQLTKFRDQIQLDVMSKLTHSRFVASPPNRVPNVHAYEAYLRARSNLMRRTDESLGKAVEGFREVISEDPAYAKAYSGMGAAYLLGAEHGITSRAEGYRSAQQYAQKAVELDPFNAEAHGTLGYLALAQDWNAQLAEKELRRATELEPNEASHHMIFALLLCNTGRFDEAIKQIDEAHADDPLWPPIYLTEMYIAVSERRFDRARKAARRLIRLKPDWPLARDQEAWVLWYSGQNEAAINEWIAMAEMENDGGRKKFEQDGLKAYRRGGVKAYARVELNAIHSGAHWEHPNDFLPAEWYLAAGDSKRALDSLEDQVAQHDFFALQLAVSPAYEALHKDPRFLTLVRSIGLHLPGELSVTGH